ncbi:hypothetical protein BKE38_24920 [Pseudoroseomonas deserti]|uniref:DUF2189 domain-containing protein n=1 Tax=Teichococcus deserti TaxID=1817963 RepID=A0A1V2GVD5_9PROT|nr:DUF2189 domain-containing protein [Pseudoroseomonas deserti]ONG46749.1 hypothetical protein BKE38_24920 [Pseudoroseomonas deserti]
MTSATAPRRVAHDRPWAWLAAGWRDLWAAPAVGLAYGLALAAGGWTLALLAQRAATLWAILPATAGFLLIAPLLAAGLYEVSRRRAQGLPTDVRAILSRLAERGTQLGFLGGALLLLHLFWLRLAALVFALCLGTDFAPPIDGLPLAMLRAPGLMPFLILGTGSGLLLAALAFCTAAFAAPMLLDRDVSAIEAIIASWQAVLRNPRPMALWAGLIVLFTGLALVPFFLGLAVAMPLVGHATWHAYADVFSEEQDS